MFFQYYGILPHSPEREDWAVKGLKTYIVKNTLMCML